MKCQIHGLAQMAEMVPLTISLWQRKNRVRRMIKRRYRYLVNLFAEIADTRVKNGVLSKKERNTKRLEAGDLVRVKTKEEIKATLDRWNRCRGCDIMEEMYKYCGTTQRILKRVERFVDEKDYRFKKCNGIVFLKDVFCEGTLDYGSCDRNCYFFWREDWLEKVDKSS